MGFPLLRTQALQHLVQSRSWFELILPLNHPSPIPVFWFTSFEFKEKSLSFSQNLFYRDLAFWSEHYTHHVFSIAVVHAETRLKA